ncbi:hypothetical protein TcWFU_004083 [Taenia crassiceps]|uniref:GAT domain-containing protein n=1 Tax=Taenia crassiceps TaxID=6207 RepID=A0ABR4QAX1_9CEST
MSVPVTNRSRDGGRQIRLRSGGGGGGGGGGGSGGGIEPTAQVLQVVAINGYPVVTRDDVEVGGAKKQVFLFGGQLSFHFRPLRRLQQCKRVSMISWTDTQDMASNEEVSPSLPLSPSPSASPMESENMHLRSNTGLVTASSSRTGTSQEHLDVVAVERCTCIDTRRGEGRRGDLNEPVLKRDQCIPPTTLLGYQSTCDLPLSAMNGASKELNETCRMMQQRVGEFLSQVADDAVTLTLIQLNDELNSAFQRLMNHISDMEGRQRVEEMHETMVSKGGKDNAPSVLPLDLTASGISVAKSLAHRIPPHPNAFHSVAVTFVATVLSPCHLRRIKHLSTSVF